MRNDEMVDYSARMMMLGFGVAVWDLTEKAESIKTTHHTTIHKDCEVPWDHCTCHEEMKFYW